MTLPAVRVRHPYVVIDANILGGSPFVVGSRVLVRRLWAWHRGGSEVGAIVKRYPNLGPAKVYSALAFAYDNMELVEADLARERAIVEEARKKAGK